MAPTDGNCADDQFIVAGQNLNNRIPTICGVNSGHHSKLNLISLFSKCSISYNKKNSPIQIVYVEVDNAMNGKIFLSILTAAPAARAYNIRVTQVNERFSL